jgi:peptidyl-prolyl cis-trans isomerase D
LAQTLAFDINNVDYKSKEFTDASIKGSAQNKNSILKSYDFFLNTKYDVVVNDSAVDRVKNYFK